MAILNEGRHATEGLLSEANFHRSRDVVTIVIGSGKLEPGTVLGKVTASGKFKAATSGGSDGAQNAVAVLMYPVDATDADVDATALTRDGEWKVDTLSFDASVDTDAKKTTKHDQLRAVGIIPR